MKRKTANIFDDFETATITGSRLDLTILLFCALDYAMPRETYVTDVVPMIILRNVKLLRDGDLWTMIDRINEAEKKEYGLGSANIDRPGWLRFRDNLKAELDDREAKRKKEVAK